MMIQGLTRAVSCIQDACEAMRHVTVKAPAADPNGSVERVSGSAGGRGWRWNMATMACLTGAALALGACKKEEHDKNLLAVGVAATGVAQYPNGPKFYALPAGQAEIDFSKAEWVKLNGVIQGRDFSKDELADLYAVLDAVRSTWSKCDNTPLKKFARLDLLLNGKRATPDTLGVAYRGAGLVAFADSARNFGFRIVVGHELGHALLQYADPTTCKTYNDPYDNPLVIKWMERMGWKDNKTLDSPFIPGTFTKEQVVRQYALESPLEDMAESFTYYLGNRDNLRKLSPARAAFFDELFKQLGVEPPNALNDPPAFKYYVQDTERKLAASPSNRLFQFGFKPHGSNEVVIVGLDRNWHFFVEREAIK